MKLLIIALLVACAYADVSHILTKPIEGKTGEANAKILSHEQDSGLEGQYRWEIKTDNGISASEQGEQKIVPGAEGPSETVQGFVRYTSPEGQNIEVVYNADENGYNAQGSHIPTSPPIPEAILRSLEYIRTHPPKEINSKTTLN